MSHPRYVVPMGDSHVAFINADFTLSYVRTRYAGETGFAFGAREVSASHLAELERVWRTIPRLTYDPVIPPVSVTVPFSGFYDSLWSQIVDYAESSFLEGEVERQEDETSDDFQPVEALRLSG